MCHRALGCEWGEIYLGLDVEARLSDHRRRELRDRRLQVEPAQHGHARGEVGLVRVRVRVRVRVKVRVRVRVN